MQVIGIVAQILVWAMMFMMLGEFPDLYVSAYHSAVNFATLLIFASAMVVTLRNPVKSALFLVLAFFSA